MKTKQVLKSVVASGIAVSMMGAVVLTGCDPEVPQRDYEPVDRVEVVFDPDTGVIPLPNDAALDDGRLPGLPEFEEGTVEEEFSNYLRLLHGWLPTTPIEIPFSGPLDEETVDEDGIRLYRFVGDDDLERAGIADFVYSEDEEGHSSLVEVIPETVGNGGDQFAVIVTSDVESADGVGVGASLPMFYAASPAPLVDADGQPALEVMADQPEQAQALEGLRLLVKPVIDAVEEGVGDDDPVDRDDLAIAFRWTISPDTKLDFDPDAARVPIPNTAALDDDGTFPEAATCHAGENTAQGYFDDYLAGLSGWPDVTPISVPLTGAIDPESIGDDDVQLWREADGEWERVAATASYRDEDVDPCTGETSADHIIDVVPEEAMGTREQYFAFVTRDVEPADGSDQLIPEIPMYLALQPHDLVDEEGASLLPQLSDEDAQGIQGLKEIVAPAMAEIEAQTELDYQDLAGVWNWYTWDDTFVVFDPDTGEIPFPNLMMMGDDGTVELPIPEDADPMTEAIVESLNMRGGFSSHAPGWIPLDGKVDPETVTKDAFSLGVADDQNLLDDELFDLRYEEEWDRIVFEPLITLEPNAIYAPILIDQLMGVNERPVQSPPLFIFLRSPYELAEDGQSLVDQLDDETAVLLETARSDFESAGFWFLIQGRTDASSREEITYAGAFETDDPVQPLREYRALALDVLDERGEVRAYRECEIEENCGEFEEDGDPHLVEVDDEIEYPGTSGDMVDMSNVSAMYTGGEFMSAEVNAAAGTVAESEERIGITVFLPEEEQGEGDCEPPYDVAISQHGLTSDRHQGGLVMANEMAAYPGCMATVAMDFPLHGGRTAGVDTPHPEEPPPNSGEGFFSEDIAASTGNFIQAMIDLFVLARVIEGDEGESGLEGLFAELDEEENGSQGQEGENEQGEGEGEENGIQRFGDGIGYVGGSLGGILGTPFVALDPNVDTAVLNAAGGRMKWLLEGDEEGVSDIGEPLFAAMGLEPGDLELFEALTMVQWLTDIIDPATFANFAADGEHRTLAYNAEDEAFGPTTGDTCEDSEDCPGGWQCEEVGEEDLCVEYAPEVDALVQMARDERTIVNRTTEALAEGFGASLDDTTFEGVSHYFATILDESDDDFVAGQCARQQAAAWLESGLFDEATLPAELTADECTGQ